MNRNIKTIRLEPNAGNFYLIETPAGFILIITGKKFNYNKLHEKLSELSCTSENLNLIISTNRNTFKLNDLNLLREKYHVKIAMHIIDEVFEYEYSSRLEQIKIACKKWYMKIRKIKEFKPDFIIDEGYSLFKYGLNARILNLSSVSKGSIGILTDEGELFCDDLCKELKSEKSIEKAERIKLLKLKNFLIDMVYPGHGNPFSLQSLRF